MRHDVLPALVCLSVVIVAVSCESRAEPAGRPAVAALEFGVPSPAFPYHHVSLALAEKAVEPGKVTCVEVDGKRNRDARFFNVGVRNPGTAEYGTPAEGETYEGRADGGHDFKVVAPCHWTDRSKHSIRVEFIRASGGKVAFAHEGTAPDRGGYWDADRPRSVSITVHETAGLNRQAEPVHLSLGLFDDDVQDPDAEIRVVTYDPGHPKAGPDGYVVAPCQVTAVRTWRDEKVLAIEEKDADTGEPVHRYDATTTVDLVFLAEASPLEEKVYQVLYGKPGATPAPPETDLKVQQQEGLRQIVETEHYRIGLAANSGAVETVTLLAGGKPVLLEHKLETNGAVHWNPGCYAPPTPWVHASDWENPEFRQITGPVMHRTRRYAPLPHMDSVLANVSYTFYARQPFVISSTLMTFQRETFVKAVRNGEIVFNHAVLNEFVWKDHLGKVRSLEIESSRRHPIHALEIPPDTTWMAFINREEKVGFGSIMLAYENGNLYGDPASEAQPYLYIQNGPWIYWSRAMVYPFGAANLTRLMPVRRGSFYLEKNAYLPFRLVEADNPFEEVERIRQRLVRPLLVHEWMPTDDRTPDHWVSPLLTMPFDEGVAGARTSQK